MPASPERSSSLPFRVTPPGSVATCFRALLLMRSGLPRVDALHVAPLEGLLLGHARRGGLVRGLRGLGAGRLRRCDLLLCHPGYLPLVGFLRAILVLSDGGGVCHPSPEPPCS